MMLMPSNDSSATVHYLAGKFPGRIGWIIGPSHLKQPKPWIPYALDNDAFSAFSRNEPWNYDLWKSMLKWARMIAHKPLWAIVPDVVSDRIATLENWKKYSPEVHDFGFSMAFAVQDGMTPDDVPEDASIVFIGGSTQWKWKSLPMWTKHFKRVHVGRVNMIRRLWTCEDHGVESVDGTGWFRGGENSRQSTSIFQWINGERIETPDFPEFKGKVFA